MAGKPTDPRYAPAAGEFLYRKALPDPRAAVARQFGPPKIPAKKVPKPARGPAAGWDSPNFKPGTVKTSGGVTTDPATGIGAYHPATTVAAPRPNTNAVVRRPKPVAPPKAKPKGTPGKPNTAPVDTKPAPPPPRTPATTAAPVSPPVGYTPLTPQAMAKLAQLQASSAINFQVKPLLDEIATTNEQSTQHAAAVAGFAKAMGELLAPVGSNLTNAYGSAANAVAAYGKGYSSDTLKQDAGANAVGAAPELNAAQQAAVQAGYAGMPSDVMYGLHGADPATSLRQLGTALGGIYGAALPSAAMSAGQQWLSSAQSEGLAQLKALQNKVAETRAGYTPAYQSALNSIQDSDLKNRAFDLSQRIQLGGMTGYDPATGQPTAATVKTNAATTAAARKINPTISKVYGVQMNSNGDVITRGGKPVVYPGSPQKVDLGLSKVYRVLMDNTGTPILNAKNQMIPLPATSPKAKTLTLNQINRYHGVAGEIVKNAFNGFTDKNGVVHAPISLGAAMEELRHTSIGKIPEDIARAELARWYNPRERKRLQGK